MVIGIDLKFIINNNIPIRSNIILKGLRESPIMLWPIMSLVDYKNVDLSPITQKW